MMNNTETEASIETEKLSRMPALKDIVIFAIIALTVFGISALI
jgi:hypothetical protein